MSEPSTSAANGHDAAAPAEALLERARLTFDLDVDICVIGAGLAGLTVAREAARLGASVAVLEGRHVGWNASGHQLGTVMPHDARRSPKICRRRALSCSTSLSTIGPMWHSAADGWCNSSARNC